MHEQLRPPDDLRLYLRYAAVSVRSQMQYRASFLILMFGHFWATAMSFVGIWALFYRFGSLRGWSLAEAALFFGVIQIAFSLAEGGVRGFDTFHLLVRAGDFDRLLLRPRSTALQVVGQEVQLFRGGRLIQGLLVLGWGVARAGVVWTIPKVGLLLLAIAGGACLFSGVFIFQATLAFWTVDTLEIVNAITYGGTETAQYPLTVYRRWFREFFTWIVPLACINYLPLHAVLGRTDPLGTPVWWQWLAPLVGFAFLLVSLRVWRVGVRHYRSTGS